MLLERRSRPVRGVRVVTRESAPFGVQVVPTRMLTVSDVHRTLDRLPRTEGPIVTSALSSIEQRAFIEAGFIERECLHLLRHDLRRTPRHKSSTRIRPARRTDLPAVLGIDQLSFDTFWSFDRAGIAAARKATPVHRYVVAVDRRRVVGYAITGQSGAASFLQRLAVHPDHRAGGVGSHLVSDAIDWARRRGSTYMMVNTQESNQRAFNLYRKLGFTVDRDSLKVLEWRY